MGRALLTVGALGTLGLITTAVLGYQTVDFHSAERHLLVGLASCVLLLFSHCWILFYLIGTGKAIREAVEEHGLDAALVAETKDYKRRSSGLLTLAMMLVMATFIVGGGVDTGAVPGWVHQGLFWITLAVQLRALWVEQQVLAENVVLMRRVDGLVRRAAV